MTLWLVNLAEAWWAWMAPMSVQFTALVIVVAVVERLLSRWSRPELPLVLWLVVLIKLLVPPTLHSPVSVAELAQEAVHVVPTSAAKLPADRVVVLSLIWLAGVGVFSVAAVWRYRRLHRACIGAGAAGADATLTAFAGCVASRLGLKRVPTIRVHAHAAGPGVFGFLRPVVVLPQDLLDGARRDRLEHVLMHEFAHIRRRDPLVNLAGLVLQIVYWFHPLVWVARMRLATCCEICCDRRVARALNESAPAYRQTLLELARTLLHRPAIGGIGFVQRHSQILARLEWLERPLSNRRWLQQAAAYGLAIITLACVVPLAPAHLPPSLPLIAQVAPGDGCLRLRYAVFSALADEERESSQYVAGERGASVTDLSSETVQVPTPNAGENTG